MEKGEYEPKFLPNYNIPGFYNFYKKLSNYINNNITQEYFQNEKKLRTLLKGDIEKEKNQFYEKEEYLLSCVNNEIKNSFIYDIMNKIQIDLILKDYINYYLNKYNKINSKSDINHKLLELLLKLRFNEKNKIIKDSQNSPIKILIIKIIWIESNANYILNILRIFDLAKDIFFDNGKKLYNMIEKTINNEDINIRYITNQERNPEHTKEVNECYSIFLASLCFSIISDEIILTESNNLDKNYNEVDINYYCFILKKINNLLKKLNQDLLIFSNEIYIIGELIKIIELFMKLKIDFEKIVKIKTYFRENALILQKKSSDNISELEKNFSNIYNLLTSIEIKDKGKENYYDTLRYIYFIEIKKVSDIKYQSTILEKILAKDEIIKKSNNIFQILLKQYLKTRTNDFIKNIYEILNGKNEILNGKDEIIKLIEISLTDKVKDNYFVLSETLLYFFEKNSSIYLNNTLNNKKQSALLEEEPLNIFKNCIEFLNAFKQKKIMLKLKHIRKLFCLGYIKVFCYTLIKILDDTNPKIQIFINIINQNKHIYKMINLYICKIFDNNQNQINAFFDLKKIKKFLLKEFSDNYISFLKEEQINYSFETLKSEEYEKAYYIIKKLYFKEVINEKEFDIEKLCVDNFYFASNYLALAYLKKNNYEKAIDTYKNFYNNVSYPLFKKENKLLKAIELFYDPLTYDIIKNKYGINSSNIDALLYGYRFCLNELSIKNEKGIYYSLYNIDKISNLTNNYFPGNDIKNEPYYELYSKIINHFSEKPNEGCYVCLCKKGFYHSILSGFPGFADQNMKCPKCLEPIGAINIVKEFNIVKRDNYFRLFKDDDEIGKEKNNRNDIEKINIISLKKFKEQYIDKLFKIEKGISINDKNHFKKDNKIIRNLGQISYRLLNYILYSHLFFAKLLTNKKNLDNYLPRGMNWVETLTECLILLKNELSKKGINSIQIFMNFIFKELFNKLNNIECIENYEDLIDYENQLELLIQRKINEFKEENKNYQKLINEVNENKYSFINLLKEKYENINYLKGEYPFYEYFFYSDYLDENYLREKIIMHIDENKYPVLNRYLEKQKNNSEKKDYILSNLNLFNTVLNLFNEKYSHQITREFAEKAFLKNEEIYYKNKELINKFIQFINELKKTDSQKNNVYITINNHLCDFVLDENNEIGRIYKEIYKRFIREQNKEIEHLLDLKIDAGIFDNNCKDKINIQNIKEDEIFTLNLPNKNSFSKLIFDSSYRKIIDSKDYKLYNQYQINTDYIEDKMTDLLLRNKKLLNEDIITFKYKNELFSNTVNDLITTFKNKYLIKEIDLSDKEILYKFSLETKANSCLCKNVINDFITLLQYLNDLRKKNNEKKNDISEDTNIYEIIEKLKDNVSNDFLLIFKDKNGLTIDKITEIFEYYLQLIYDVVENEIKSYQEELKEEDNLKQKINTYNQKEHIIKEEDFSSAIRLFMILILFREEDKDEKIKSNHNNIINYLKEIDLWHKDIYNDEKFNEDLNELKEFNIRINQILSFNKLLEKKIKRKEKEVNNINDESESEEEEKEYESNIDEFSSLVDD